MFVSRKSPLWIWALFCAVAGGIFLVYAFASLATGRGEFVLPLDDVYIHFQYARQLTNGQPYVYNPGQPPTSGATSFLYPYVLAFGYLLGFQGLNLGLWALVVGGLSLVGSIWLVYLLVKQFDAPNWLAIAIALIFALTGAVSWHFMSGMETGLMMMLTLATLYMVIAQRFPGFIMAASLLALTRPEGGVLVVVAVVVMWIQLRVAGSQLRVLPKYAGLFLLIPVFMLGVQPLVNLVVTGSVVASGNAVKSIFGTVPFYWDEVVRRILDNFARMWIEFATGYNPREGWYLPLLIGAVGLLSLVWMLAKREQRLIGAMLVVWLVLGTAAIATLDTSFWHFKRYQMPLMVLLFPLAGWGIQKLNARLGGKPSLFKLYSFAAFFMALWTGALFLHHFALNVNYVYLQPLQMARWLRANTPEDSLIAVHDVGTIRYMGGRATLDMVGLTTPEAAEYWRNGPGSTAEFLMNNRPDYIASYGEGHGYGLGMIADTRIYGDLLAGFPVTLDPNHNVALAADFQGIYQPDWEGIDANFKVSSAPAPQSNLDAMDAAEFGAYPPAIDTADLSSEQLGQYAWHDDERLPGFASEVYEMDVANCGFEDCEIVEAARRINGAESFTVTLPPCPCEDLILVTRVHPINRGTLDIYVNDRLAATRWIPMIPGQWLDLITLIPSQFVTEQTSIRIVPHTPGGHYVPAYHWIYYGTYQPQELPSDFVASFQDGFFVLAQAALNYQHAALEINFDWYTDGRAQGDYKVFVHILDESGEIAAQVDTYPGNGTLPPGNWLPGNLHDQIVVDLANVPSGHYRVAIGLYDPVSLERLMPQSDSHEVTADGRLFIGEIEIPDDE